MNIADLFATLSISPNQKSFDAADRLIDGIKGALIGIAAIAGVHVLEGLIDDTVKLGSHINDLAQSTGVTTDTLQEFGFIAIRNSSDMDSMGAALGKLGNNMKAAADGGKEQAAAFQKLGVRVTDTHGKLRPVEDVFEDIAINQHKMSNATEKGAAIFATLGKSGRALIPTMNDIADKGMAPLIEEAHSLGAVMSGEAITALDDFGDTQDTIKAALIGLRNTAVVALLPTLQKLADGFLGWVKANREMIALKLQVVLNIMIKALQGVAVAANFVLNVFNFLQKHWDLIKVSVLGIAAAFVVFKAASIAAAVATGVAWAVANIPLILLAALMTALVLIVDDIITAFQGGDSVIKEFFEKRGYDVDGFLLKLTKFAEDVKVIFERLFDWMSAKFGSIAKSLAGFAVIANRLSGGEDSVLDRKSKTTFTADELNAPRTLTGDDKFDKEMAASAASAAAMRDQLKGVDAALANIRAGRLSTDDGYKSVVQAPSGIDRIPTPSLRFDQPRFDQPGGTSTVTLQAPITINVSGSKDPALTGAAVKSAIEDHFQQQMVWAASGIGGVK